MHKVVHVPKDGNLAMNWQVFDTGEKFLDEVCEMFDGLAVNLEKLRAKLGLETAAEDIGAELLAPSRN